MKTILVLLILFYAIALPAAGELTVQDLDKIGSVVNTSKQELKEEIASSEKRMKEHITSFEKRMKEYIDLKIYSVEKQITLLTNFVYALIALIVVAIGIPQILIAWRSIRSKSHDEQAAQPIEQI